MEKTKRRNIRPSKVGMRQPTLKKRLKASVSLGATTVAVNHALREETAFMDSGLSVQGA